MFIGVLPDGAINQLLRSVDFESWKQVYIGCSGSFRIEQSLHKRWPLLGLHANDVSLLSCAIGRLATADPLPFTFTGELAWLEAALAGANPIDRAAGLLVALQAARFSKGATNLYKARHLDHIKTSLPGLIAEGGRKVAALLQGMCLDSFAAVDFRAHIRAGLQAGAGVIAFPPTYKGGYESQYRFLHANVDWQEPAYDVFDPSTLPDLLSELDSGGGPWCILCDQEIEGRAPLMEFVPGRNRTIFAYGSAAKPSFARKAASRSEAFGYRPLDVAAVGPQSKVSVVSIDSAKANFIKDIYLAKHIVHSTGMANYAVLIDGMLAGLLIYSLSRHTVYDPTEIYLLSDLSTTREAKVSKLIARLALSRTVLHDLEKRMVRRFRFVVTTAFSKHPVSMKYRGVFDLLKRTEVADGFSLNYGHAILDETPDQIFAWWWTKHGKAKAETQNRDRDSRGRSEDAQGARQERALHDGAAAQAADG